MTEPKFEVNVSHFNIAIDVVQSCIDFNSFIDHLKLNYKNKVLVINALDYQEKESSKSRPSHSRSSSRSKQSSSSSSMVKGIKTKIDQEVTRMIDQVKKQIAAERKARETKGRRPSAKQISSTSDISSLNKASIYVIILNFPYVPQQLKSLTRHGVEITAFVSICPENPVPTKFEHKPSEKNSKESKKKTIPGQEFDFTNCPNCYPPARWLSLYETSPAGIPFVEIKAGPDNESTFKVLEDCLDRVERAREEFSECFKDYNFISIPYASTNVDTTAYNNYLSEYYGDFTNAMYYQLKQFNFKTVAKKKKLKGPALYKDIINRKQIEANRKVSYIDQSRGIDPLIEYTIPPSTLSLLGNFHLASFTEDNSRAASAILGFITNPTNFFCYCAAKFDQIVISINKQRGFGLPASYYDLQNWNYAIEHKNIFYELSNLFRTCSHIEILPDPDAKLMFILGLAPIQKTLSQAVSSQYFPPSINGISEWVNTIFETPDVPEKKQKSKITPASILRENGDVTSLLSSFQEKLKRHKNIYRLPLQTSTHGEFYSTYAFNAGLKIDIERNVVNGAPTFGALISLGQVLNIRVTHDSIILIPYEEITFTLTFDGKMTITFYEQSIYYDRENIVTKSTGESPCIITREGDFITVEKSCNLILYSDGSTFKEHKKGEWLYCDSEGKSYIQTKEKFVPSDMLYSQISNVASGTTKCIRPDELDYVIGANEERRILLSSEILIEQTSENITYEIPSFPVIVNDKNSFVIEIHKFLITILNGIEIKCDDYSVNTESNGFNIKYRDNEVYIKKDRIEIKSGTSLFVADSNGVEKLGKMVDELPQKKKLEVVETKWGKGLPVKDILLEPQQIELTGIFKPRYIVVRSDFSATEFTRKDSITKSDEYTIVRDQVRHPSGDPCNVVIVNHPTEYPEIYVELDGLAKPNRVNIMKGLQIPKKARQVKSPKKQEKQEDYVQIANSKLEEYLDISKGFQKTIQQTLEWSYREYKESLKPKVENKEPPPPPPVQTPSPDLLVMQYNRYMPKIDVGLLNYWKMHESDFGYPIFGELKSPRPVSARRHLNDPPRFFSDYKEDSPYDETQVTRMENRKEYNNIDQKQEESIDQWPKTLTPSSLEIDFGNVTPGEGLSKFINILNTSGHPLHYSVTIPTSNVFYVKMPQGTIFPGLRKRIYVYVYESAPEGNHNLNAIIRTKIGRYEVKLHANIISE